MKKQAKEAPPKVTVVRSQIFKVFFESLYEQWDREKEDRPTSCDVLANTTEEAIEKVHAAFPREQIHMVSGPDRSYFRYNESNKRQERPQGEWIVL